MFGRNKFKKVKREDVVNAIIAQDRQQQELERIIMQKSEEVDRLMERGRTEKNRDIKLLCAKKINTLRSEIKRDTKRAAFLLYNVQLLEKLKGAIDDNSFIKNTTGLPLNKLLCDRKALAKFLQESIGNRTEAENAMVGAEELFNAYEETSDSDTSPIYAVNSSDDELLAMFELQEQMDSEQQFDSDVGEQNSASDKDAPERAGV